ncbi:DNA-binding response OmpR family regulator [Lipingzhangella halophila]|uniref:DNA-binding response OmpR family regulator n=1 Tax=Lipingzhangella halophila TaxID=1783352 RepID=A0A7W7RLR7_9ACTN|nr:response regulator transcription factor [Lipingzhangella halophila]MBB4934309.1 DNA-binding response OmpR family regulator [Lipingzhangella halophila]
MTHPSRAGAEDAPPRQAAARLGLRVLLAEPDPDVGSELLLRLAPRHIDVTVCTDGAEALFRAGLLRPDLVLVSANIELVRSERVIELIRRGLGVPIIAGIQPDTADEGVGMLRAGATACVLRPYQPDEVLTLIRSACYTATVEPSGDEMLRAGPIALDPARHQAWHADEPLTLPLREFELLHYLMHNAGRVISRDELCQQIWSNDRRLAANTITVHIRRLRQRLGDSMTHPHLIRTVRGVGYLLDVALTATSPTPADAPEPAADDPSAVPEPRGIGSARSPGTRRGHRRPAPP